MPGVDALHIGGGVCLCVTQSLSLGQGVSIAKTQAGHRIENVVAGAVHNAAHLLDGLHTAGPLQLGQPADAAANGSGATEANAFFLGQGDQLVVEAGNQSLVGGDDVLAGLNSCPDKLISRVQTTHSLHHRVDGVVVQHILEILGDFRVGEGHILQAYHLGDLHIVPVSGQVVNASANHAETKQSDFHIYLSLSVFSITRKSFCK